MLPQIPKCSCGQSVIVFCDDHILFVQILCYMICVLLDVFYLNSATATKVVLMNNESNYLTE
jgi:hypothetical protein